MITTDTRLACQDHPETFDAVLDHPDHPGVIARAKALCDGCPVQTACLIQALRTKSWGVYGGQLLLAPVRTWECKRGHDLTQPGATRQRSTGGVICRGCDAGQPPEMAAPPMSAEKQPDGIWCSGCRLPEGCTGDRWCLARFLALGPADEMATGDAS